MNRNNRFDPYDMQGGYSRHKVPKWQDNMASLLDYMQDDEDFSTEALNLNALNPEREVEENPAEA